MVIPVIEDDESCFTRDTTNNKNDITISTTNLSCDMADVFTHYLVDETSLATFDATLTLTAQTLDLSFSEPEIDCNDYPNIVTTVAGVNTIAA